VVLTVVERTVPHGTATPAAEAAGEHEPAEEDEGDGATLPHASPVNGGVDDQADGDEYRPDHDRDGDVLLD
jgi:hypothetical protein